MELGGDYSLLNRAVNPRSQLDVSTVIEGPYHVAVDNSARSGIRCAHLQQANLFHVLNHRKIAKRRIQKVVPLSG